MPRECIGTRPNGADTRLCEMPSLSAASTEGTVVIDPFESAQSVGKPHFLYEWPPARIAVQPAHARQGPDHAHARIALRAGPLEPGKGLIPLATVRENLRDLKARPCPRGSR